MQETRMINEEARSRMECARNRIHEVIQKFSVDVGQELTTGHTSRSKAALDALQHLNSAAHAIEFLQDRSHQEYRPL